MNDQIQDLIKALSSGGYNAAPGQLSQGSALQVEDLSPIMELATFEESSLKLQKMIKKKDAKTSLVQFNRQLSYGVFGGSAQFDGAIGEDNTPDVVRAVVPMCYYSVTSRTYLSANMIDTFNNVKPEDFNSQAAALKLAADIEFDSFRGQADFSNAGIFDGNPGVIAELPAIMGIDVQVRMSDSLANTQDLMFAEYGSDQSVVLSVNGAMTQSLIEDATVKSAMQQGQADSLVLDPISLSAYNKISHAKERIMLAGSAQGSTGADLRGQWTSNGTVKIESSRFLSGKTRPARATSGSPAAPGSLTITSPADGNSVLEAGDYVYYVTAMSIRGESAPSAAGTVTISAGNKGQVSIPAVSGASHFNVYRSPVGGSAASAKFIGKVKAAYGATVFYDLGNKDPGSVTGFLLQANTMCMHELAAYSRLKLAVSDLSLPEAHFSFKTLAVTLPRKNCILDNVKGQLS